MSLLLIDDQLPILDVVAERRQAAHPHALLLRRGDLVADSLAGHFPFKLSKGEQDIQGQPPHACGGVELLRDRDERDTTSVKGLHDLGEVEQRARQTVDLINDNHVDLAGGDIGEEPSQGRAVHRPSGKTAVVIQGRQDRPAFVLLGNNEGCAGFALCIE